MTEEEFQKMLKYYEQNGSPNDVRTLNLYIEKIKKENEFKNTKPKNQMFNVDGMAKNMANQIATQMGVTDKVIKKTARQMVRDMILQYDPSIPEKTIQILLNEWVPEKSRKKSIEIPKEILGSMISQFVAYSKGELSKEQLAEFPDGWVDKYWESFPEDIQRSIAAFIRNQITQKQFWQAVDSLLN